MRLDTLADAAELQALCERFAAKAGVATAILDPEGTVLVAAGSQEMVQQFQGESAMAERRRGHDTDRLARSSRETP